MTHVGASVGCAVVGRCVGDALGLDDGLLLGDADGVPDGASEGVNVGTADGVVVGAAVGDCVPPASVASYASYAAS